jgi:hypothetical protein
MPTSMTAMMNVRCIALSVARLRPSGVPGTTPNPQNRKMKFKKGAARDPAGPQRGFSRLPGMPNVLPNDSWRTGFHDAQRRDRCPLCCALRTHVGHRGMSESAMNGPSVRDPMVEAQAHSEPSLHSALRGQDPQCVTTMHRCPLQACAS